MALGPSVHNTAKREIADIIRVRYKHHSVASRLKALFIMCTPKSISFPESLRLLVCGRWTFGSVF
jgi:hypothetical protein